MKWFKPKNEARGSVRTTAPPVEAVSDSLLWQDEGGTPVARCLVHRQRLVPRDPETGALHRITEAGRIGEQTPFGAWRLHCVGANSRDDHPVDLSDSRTWDEAVGRAQARLAAALQRVS